MSENLDRREFFRRSAAVGGGLALAPLLSPALARAAESAAFGAAGGEYRIGVLAPISGVFSQFGDIISKSATLAAGVVNASGGIGGQQVKLVIEDTASDPAVTVTKARKMLQRDRVEALVGTAGSPETLGVQSLVKSAKKLFFYPVGGGLETCSDKDSKLIPYVFGLGDTQEQHLRASTPRLAKLYGKKWYFIGQDYNFGRGAVGTAKKYLKAAGGTVVGEEYAAFGTPDYAPFVDRILATDADVVFSSTVGTDGVGFVKAANNAGLLGKKTVTGWGTFSSEVFSGIKGISNGAVFNDRYSVDLKNAANRRFVAGYLAKYGARSTIAGTGAAIYGSLLLLQAGAKRAGSTSTEKLIKGLEGLQMELPQGRVRVNPVNHTLDAHQYLLKIASNKIRVSEDLGTQRHPGLQHCGV